MRFTILAGLVSASCAFGLCIAAPARAEDSVDGLWRTRTNDKGAWLHVRVGPCAADASMRCGVVEEAFNASDPGVVGKDMIFDMVDQGGGKWDDGRIWAPDDDKTYSASMELKGPDLLEVEGCVLFFCRGQDWTRVR